MMFAHEVNQLGRVYRGHIVVPLDSDVCELREMLNNYGILTAREAAIVSIRGLVLFQELDGPLKKIVNTHPLKG